MIKNAACAIAMVLSVACAPDVDVGPDAMDGVEPAASNVWGDWFMTYANDCTEREEAVSLRFELVDGETVVRWGLHQSFDFEIKYRPNGAEVWLESTFGPRETLELVLVDNGNAANATITWLGYLGSDRCVSGPVVVEAAHTPPAIAR